MKVLLVGMGGLGPWLLERLVRSPAVESVVAADRDGDRVAGAVGGVRLALTLEERPIALAAERLDLTDVDATARALDRLRPDLIVQAASLLPVDRWWTIAATPDAGPRLQAAGLGPWLPLQLLLPLRLAEAIARSGCGARLLNLSYPDAVNAVVARRGYPTPFGSGNVSLLAAAVRAAVADVRAVPVTDVSVALCTHYAHLRWAMGGGLQPASHGVLRVEVAGADVTAELDPFELIRRGGESIPWGAHSHALTAAALARHVELLAGDEPVAEHMAGPCGLAGGYPVEIGRDGVRVMPPPGADLAQLIRMQQAAQRDDGIARIAPDGTVTLTDTASGHMTDLFGFAHAELTPDAVEARAGELLTALQGFPTSTGSGEKTRGAASDNARGE